MTMPHSSTTIVVADDHPMFRHGLIEVIQKREGYHVLAEANDGEEAVLMIERFKPNIAILDLKMPRKNGLEVVRSILQSELAIFTIILTMYDEEEMFRKAVDLGVMGYILKESAVDEIVQGIAVVARGDCYYSPSLAARALKAKTSNTPTQEQEDLESLTPTERKVLAMVAEYKSTVEIADELYISPRTVEHHREHICQKLNLTGRYSLVRYALEHRNTLNLE